MSRVIIIGGGASGMMAAIAAADNGHHVTLLEKNDKLGKKLFITGKGRCNLTNACDAETFFDHIMSGKKFMYSAFYGFSNDETIGWFEAHGLTTKTERGERVFPASDQSSDVIKALETTMRSSNPTVRVRLQTAVEKLLFDQERITGVLLKDRTSLEADAVIVATGG